MLAVSCARAFASSMVSGLLDPVGTDPAEERPLHEASGHVSYRSWRERRTSHT